MTDYGPGGYLPERAAKRARKIVLRERMSLGWPLAALVAGLLLAGIGVVYLVTQTGPPAPPFVDAGPVDSVDPRGAGALTADGAEVLVVRAGGGVRVFAVPDAPPDAPVRYCPSSRRLEASQTGDVWTLDGRAVGGPGGSLRPLPARVHEGRVYVDPHSPLEAQPPVDAGESPQCPGQGTAE